MSDVAFTLPILPPAQAWNVGPVSTDDVNRAPLPRIELIVTLPKNDDVWRESGRQDATVTIVRRDGQESSVVGYFGPGTVAGIVKFWQDHGINLPDVIIPPDPRDPAA